MVGADRAGRREAAEREKRCGTMSSRRSVGDPEVGEGAGRGSPQRTGKGGTHEGSREVEGLGSQRGRPWSEGPEGMGVGGTLRRGEALCPLRRGEALCGE